jgi:sec-independent protein translocase protein TatA
MGLFGLGAGELVVIAGVAVLVFGPSKLPELGKGLGKTVKSFQTAAKVLLQGKERHLAAEDTVNTTVTAFVAEASLSHSHLSVSAQTGVRDGAPEGEECWG